MTPEEKIKEEISEFIDRQSAFIRASVLADKLFDIIISPQILVMLVEMYHQRLKGIRRRFASSPDIDKRSPDEIIGDFIFRQEPLGEEFSKVLEDNRWELYEK